MIFCLEQQVSGSRIQLETIMKRSIPTNGSSNGVSARVATAIQFLMKKRGLNEVELANRVGIPRTTLRTYLSGNLKTLNLDKLSHVSEALGVTLGEILSVSEQSRGFVKKEAAAGTFVLMNLAQYKMRIECDTPLNAYHAHGRLYFHPGAYYPKQKESERDIWFFLKSEGGIITFDYNGESLDVKGGDRIIFNARHPYAFRYLTDDRNQRKLKEKDETKQQIACIFSSSPPFWLF